jgi:hypothetical protein
MKKQLFRVSFYYEEKGTVDVWAENGTEAELQVYKELADNGIENLSYECTDRDYDTTGNKNITE